MACGWRSSQGWLPKSVEITGQDEHNSEKDKGKPANQRQFFHIIKFPHCFVLFNPKKVFEFFDELLWVYLDNFDLIISKITQIEER
jgi:hypothetical protein